MREAKERLTLPGDWQFTDLRIRRVVDYVIRRQNKDGGYTFCQGIDSNAQDTYYGLAILNLLGVTFPNLEKTVKWLRSFVPDNLYSHYYIAKALELCGEEPSRKSIEKFVLSLPIVKGDPRRVEVYAEVASEFLSVFMATELANMIGIKVDDGKIAEWLLSFQNDDGGFGIHRHSNLNSTYYAVASLSSLSYPVKQLKDVLRYVRACEKPYGGFTVVPSSATPFMEHAYYGVSTLSLLGESSRYPRQTADFVLKCQNANGGFARSDLGISTFEDTFYAISILKTISKQGGISLEC